MLAGRLLGILGVSDGLRLDASETRDLFLFFVGDVDLVRLRLRSSGGSSQTACGNIGIGYVAGGGLLGGMKSKDE